MYRRELFLFINKYLILLDGQGGIVAYLDSFSLMRDLRQARLASSTGMVSLRKELSSAFHFEDARQSALMELLKTIDL